MTPVGMSDEHRSSIAVIVSTQTSLLVDGFYDLVASMSPIRSLSPDELRQGVESLGQPIVEPPVTEWSWQPAGSAVASASVAFDLEVPLWTASGRSGLGLKLHLVETPAQTFDAEIEGFCEVDPLGDFTTEGPQPDSTLSDTDSRASAITAPVRSDPIPPSWRPVVTTIVHRLATGDYAGLARDGFVTYATDPDDASIGTWIEDHPHKLVELPAHAWAHSDYGETDEPGRWWFTLELWDEQGRSDLVLEGFVWDDGGEITAKIQGVHAM